MKHRIMWVKCMAICYEVVETGILFLQQYNTGYYKGIADDSFAAMIRQWFHWCTRVISHVENALPLAIGAKDAEIFKEPFKRL